MSTKTIISVEEYLINEVQAEYKSEYHAGEVRAMSGGQPPHNQISSNINAAFLNCLKKKGCRVYSSDQSVHIPECEKFVFPDVTVVCDKPVYHQRVKTGLKAVLNPKIIVEVLSESTELYDRTEKFDCYKKLATFQEYVLIDSKKTQVEVYRRQPNGWLHNAVNNPKNNIDVMGCKIVLEDIYYGVDFD